MDQLPVISVRGEAWLEAEPEIAALAVTVQARDRDRRAVLDRLVSRNKEVLDLVRGYGEAVEKLESRARRPGTPGLRRGLHGGRTNGRPPADGNCR